ncbi:MAG: MoaF-related domain-containing protein [bacterium]
MYNKELEYNFTDYVIIDLTFGSDTTLYWRELKSGSDANEDIMTIHINDHTTLTGWVEHDKTVVSLFSDFAKWETYGFQYFNDGSVRELIGTIKAKK